MFFKSKSVLLALIAITACVAQSTFAADDTNETLMPKGMWKDSDTGLIWMRCSLGQTWNDHGCDGEAEKYTWWDAIKTADQLTFGGQSDWRVPTASELASLMHRPVLRGKAAFLRIATSADRELIWSNKDKTTKNNEEKNLFYTVVIGYKESGILKPNNDTLRGMYWSVSPYAYYGNGAWYVDFDYGVSDNNIKDNNLYVRPVRSSQSLGGKALLEFSQLAQTTSADEATYHKKEVVRKAQEAKDVERAKQEIEAKRIRQDQQACERLYIGKAVTVRLCNALFGCTNFSAEIVGIGNGNATAKLTADGGLYGERRELRCDQF